MSAGNHTYNMSSLMKCKELNAFAAQRDAGSAAAYFELLDAFTEEMPAIVRELIPPQKPDELESFLPKIDRVQARVQAVGATLALLEAESVSQLARAGKLKECAEKTSVLAYLVRALVQVILDAQSSANTATEADVFQVTNGAKLPTSVTSPSAHRPHAPLSSASFEKVVLLIENFQEDEALELVTAMMEFSYTSDVDTALHATRLLLSTHNHDAANAEAQWMLSLVRTLERKASGHGKKRILAIDDTPDVLSVVKSVLSDRYTVYGVTNHMAALKFLSTNKADLILLDIEMPDMDGFALLSIIRKIKACEKIPVVFLTGSVSVENVKKSLELGGNDFIKKPVDAKVLLTKLKNHLGE